MDNVSSFKGILYAVVLIAQVFMPGQAYGADNGPPHGDLPQPLHLQQAIDFALQNNFAVQQAAARVRLRRGEAAHAGRIVPANPELSVEAGRREGPANVSTDIGIAVSQELWTGNKRGLRHEAAAARSEGARAELEFLQVSVAARSRGAFLDVLLGRESVRTAERVLAIARELQSFTRQRLAAGEATRLEVNTAAIAAGRAAAALAAARRELTRARLALADVLSVDPAGEIDIAGTLKAGELQIPDMETLLARSLQRRQDLAAAAQGVVAARRELSLSKRRLIPNLTVTGFYKKEESRDDIAGLGLSLPLPLLHRYDGEQQAAAARLDDRVIERDALRLQVRRQVLQAVADYRAAREQVEVLTERMLEAAEENVRLTRTAFRAGKVGTPAITTAQDNLFTVRRAYLDALGQLINAAAALERATGGLIRMAGEGARNQEKQ